MDLTGVVAVVFADDDAVVAGNTAVEVDEVLAVEGDDDSVILDGVSEDIFVGDALVGLACVVRGEDVVAEITQEEHHIDGEVFVGVEINHELGCRRRRWR